MLYERPWPNDLPHACPKCGVEFRSRVNLVIGPGAAARGLRSFAYGMIIPWMIISLVIFTILGMPNFGRGGGYIILGLMIVPPAFLGVLSFLFPGSRRVICKCGWKNDFDPLPMDENSDQSRY